MQTMLVVVQICNRGKSPWKKYIVVTYDPLATGDEEDQYTAVAGGPLDVCKAPTMVWGVFKRLTQINHPCIFTKVDKARQSAKRHGNGADTLPKLMTGRELLQKLQGKSPQTA